jgi:hypothetical protein
MKKSILFTLLFVSFIITSYAQKGNNQVGIAGEIGFPAGHFDNDFNTGFGGSLKGLWGIGKNDQLTFTTGYTYYKAKGQLTTFFPKAYSSIIPFLAGYRFNKSGFYAEPQIGFGLYRLKIGDYYGGKNSETDGAFTYGIGVGFVSHGIDAGVRYQEAKKGSDDITIIGVHIGYNISFRK